MVLCLDEAWDGVVREATFQWMRVSASLIIQGPLRSSLGASDWGAPLHHFAERAFHLRGLEFVSCTGPPSGSASAAHGLPGELQGGPDVAASTRSGAPPAEGVPAAPAEAVPVEAVFQGTAIAINAAGFGAVKSLTEFLGGRGFSCSNPIQWLYSNSSNKTSNSSSKTFGPHFESSWRRLPPEAEAQLHEICVALTAGAVPAAALPAALTATAATAGTSATFTLDGTHYLIETSEVQRMLQGHGRPWISAEPKANAAEAADSSATATAAHAEGRNGNILVSRIALMPPPEAHRHHREGAVPFL